MSTEENQEVLNKVSEELSEVMFHMDHFASADFNDDGSISDDSLQIVGYNAWLLTQLLESVGAKEIPTVLEIIDDFALRCAEDYELSKEGQ